MPAFNHYSAITRFNVGMKRRVAILIQVLRGQIVPPEQRDPKRANHSFDTFYQR